jgi:hypothetical protein
LGSLGIENRKPKFFSLFSRRQQLPKKFKNKNKNKNKTNNNNKNSDRAHPRPHGQ